MGWSALEKIGGKGLVSSRFGSNEREDSGIRDAVRDPKKRRRISEPLAHYLSLGTKHIALDGFTVL